MALLTLEEVCEFVLDGTHGSPVRTNHGIPVYSAKNVTKNGFVESTDRFTTEKEFQSFNKRLPLAIGDVLITIVGTIGRVSILESNSPMVFQRSIGVLRPNLEIITSKYLYHYLKTNFVKRQIASRINQSTQAGIYLGKLKTIEVEVPSIEDQNRITSILDKTESIEKSIELAKDKKNIVVHSIFTSLFGDVIRNTFDFPITELGKVVTVNMGQSPSGESYNEIGDGTPFLQGNAEFTTLYPIHKKWTNEAKKMSNKGDILLSVRAPVGAINIADQEYCIGRGLAAIEPNDILNQEYLQYCLSFMVVVLQSKATGSTFKAVTAKTLKSFEIPIPPFPLQQRFASILSKIRGIDFEVSRIQSLKLQKSAVQEMLR